MLLDASFLIDVMEGRPEAVALARSIDREGSPLRIPSPVLFELWVGSLRSARGEVEIRRIEELVTAYETVSFDATDAREAGALQARLAGAGRSLGTVDVQLAGMAVARSEELVTGDKALAAIGRGVPVRSYRRT